MLQLNYQKYIPLPASASPEKTQHLPKRPASVRGIITPVLFTQFASFPPKSYLQKDISSRSGLHELPALVRSGQMGGIIQRTNVLGQAEPGRAFLAARTGRGVPLRSFLH